MLVFKEHVPTIAPPKMDAHCWKPQLSTYSLATWQRASQ